MQRDPLQNPLSKVLPAIIILAGVGLLFISLAGGRMGLRTADAAFSTNQLVLVIAAVGILLSGLLLLPRARAAAETLLLVSGAVAVVLASDLYFVTGLASVTYKAALLLVFAAAFASIRLADQIESGETLVAAFRSLLTVDFQALMRFGTILLQLLLLGLAITAFKLENQVFYGSVIRVVFFGFILHDLLAPEKRIRFFLFLSIATFLGVLGVINGIWLVGIVGLVIGIMHIPLSFRLRTILVLVVGGVLFASRAGYIETVPVIIWPVLGSVMMFRGIIYLYDLAHTKKPFDIWYSLSYFLLLPNVLFPFFPVVDHKTFTNTYYNQDKNRIYQVGAAWIFRGVYQLIAYRFVYYYLAISPLSVDGPLTLIQFAFSSFLLYLQVSGQFHLVIGILHLFGFNLPQTNDNYLLSTNFSDLWRRANIYWKDFMQKVFYYPSYTFFSRRGLKTLPALMLTTVYVFVGTWFLHAWYWFWLRGSFLLTVNDALFWTILALLVMANIVRETRTGRKRSLGTKQPTIREIISLGLQNAATLSLLTFVWTMWTSPTMEEFLNVWSTAFQPKNIPGILLGYAGVAVVFILMNLVYRLVEPRVKAWMGASSPVSMGLMNAGLVLVVLLAGTPAVYSRLGARTSDLLADLTTVRLNDADANLLLRGYYENLISVSRFNTELWDVYSKRPTDWPALQDTPAARQVDTFELFVLNPDVSILFHGAQFSTNEWGMRDKSYTKVPAPGTMRAVILGPSFVMGSGVATNETFEALMEDRLNEEYAGGKYDAYEILNFGVAGHSALQELFVYEFKALEFQPTTLFYIGHQLEESILVRNLANRIRARVDIPYPYLEDLITQAGIDPAGTQEQVERQLAPYGKDLLLWTYQRFVSLSREHGVYPVWIYMPTLEFPDSPEDRSAFTALAEEAGFVTVDLSHIYDGQDITAISVAAWDLHPNQEGHRLIARLFFEALLANPEISAELGIDGR